MKCHGLVFERGKQQCERLHSSNSMANIDEIMKYVELGILCVIVLDRFIAFCYYPTAGGWFTWMFFLAYEALLGLSCLNISFMTKLYEQEFPFMIHKIPRAIAMIVLFFVYIPVGWGAWYDIIMGIFILLLLACGIYELVIAILEIINKNGTKKADNTLAGEPSQPQVQAQPQPQPETQVQAPVQAEPQPLPETVPTQPEENKEVIEEKPQQIEQPAEVKQEEAMTVAVEAKDVEAQE